jgi:hypothetical protein
MLRKKARQLNEEALIEIERHRNIQDSRKFYKRLNYVRWPFERTTSGYVSSQKRGTINQQKPNAGEMERTFGEHLNKGSGSEQPTRPVDLRDDGVDIDLPSR